MGVGLWQRYQYDLAACIFGFKNGVEPGVFIYLNTLYDISANTYYVRILLSKITSLICSLTTMFIIMSQKIHVQPFASLRYIRNSKATQCHPQRPFPAVQLIA